MPIPIITPTLLLSPPTKQDAAELFKLRTDPQVNTYIKRQVPTTIADVEEFIERINANPTETIYLLITIKETNQLAGVICLKRIDGANNYAELGYELLPQYQRKGIMSEALQAILNVAFEELGIQYIEAYTHKENQRSRKLLEKFNFKEVIGKIDEGNATNVIYGREI